MNQSTTQRALVLGGGIAGMTSAWWLHHAGCEVEVVDAAPQPERDGSTIDFYGRGFDVAAEMGLLPELELRALPIRRWVFEDHSGMHLLSLDYEAIRRRLFRGRHLTMLKADLEGSLRARVAGLVEIAQGITVTSVQPYGPRIVASFGDGHSKTYDFIVGAGETSPVTRRTWFSRDAACERFLGFHTVSFSVHDPELRMRIGDDLHSLSAAGRQVTISPGHGACVFVTFVFRRTDPLRDETPEGIAEVLEGEFGDFGKPVLRLVAAAPYATDMNHTALTEVRLANWSIGGMVLIGDACHCPSTLNGSCVSLAMAGAKALARAIERSPGNVPRAFAEYERRLRPVVRQAQTMGARMIDWIAPGNKLSMMARDAALRMATWPLASGIGRHLLGA